MKNAFVRFGYTCASMLIAGGLATTAASAATTDLASVNLPHAVTVGEKTLPSGHYTIVSEGGGAYLIQSDNGHESAVVLGQQLQTNQAAPKTEVVLSGSADSLKLDKLVIAGQTSAYEFRQ